MENLLSYIHVLHKTLNLVFSNCCLAVYSEEIYQIYNASAEPLFFPLNPIVLWRSRCRRRNSFFNSGLVS